MNAIPNTTASAAEDQAVQGIEEDQESIPEFIEPFDWEESESEDENQQTLPEMVQEIMRGLNEALTEKEELIQKLKEADKEKKELKLKLDQKEKEIERVKLDYQTKELANHNTSQGIISDLRNENYALRQDLHQREGDQRQTSEALRKSQEELRSSTDKIKAKDNVEVEMTEGLRLFLESHKEDGKFVARKRKRTD
ncbi:hypothetical protein BFW01_g9946 [Lasiodiplodia theobromae]|nr:hypothetical protein BFW01_g9946 [Lasiodiplodia theobromae]